ncbi:MAG TPA: bifunctional diaminohydroxyphosphoribosylaminopyrimidine deaminase/5-amino-6-(5-phosphoribosylamino)uracil reductase RibD [Flexivirga sp.]|uniref:bifunctional diaminohydroxyphosphoribosylaminopyrimidine deaminase/5-amino-6-(5-phosphoribosylamino)uracil reductase RibD n=1 Tax=Flexivirga sp. TaxID=1962927 RepID=UPI002B5CEB13|nr:bifunctional diaminohydroxyphosphoribosylaminopyrimidine deaminase/5-amino-6-(5-phosphoribosylamino)uracil reductase RibD [Flexivirga sp.]HWC22000.1 bifunctional diaminohydroxyphosphoribosylaminopyrimidine deaminase/5-amino-6-(5-phosphoribosylamino)uracil reductase RibD [Flexivirga sp.]
MQRPDFEQPMRAALDLAARGPVVDPNPRVGCVLVRDGEIVGRGWHAGAGTPHAEVGALTEAGERARGATAYVTLEPCAHTGRTGPCADALTDAGVSRVVYGQSDPNPVARGGGEVLRGRGIEVHGGVLADEAAALNERWTYAVTHEKPWVTWKFAMTVDGRSAAADGTSQWISNEQSRADVHELRRHVGAIVVGTGTALADDPQLTARAADGAATGPQPLRVVVGDRDLPAGARLLDDAADTLHLRTHDLAAVTKELHARDIRTVLLEGGPTLGAAFCAAGLVDEIVAYVAPLLLGAGSPAVGPLGVGTLSDATAWTLYDVTRLADDVRLSYRRK